MMGNMRERQIKWVGFISIELISESHWQEQIRVSVQNTHTLIQRHFQSWAAACSVEEWRDWHWTSRLQTAWNVNRFTNGSGRTKWELTRSGQLWGDRASHQSGWKARELTGWSWLLISFYRRSSLTQVGQCESVAYGRSASQALSGLRKETGSLTGVFQPNKLNIHPLSTNAQSCKEHESRFDLLWIIKFLSSQPKGN